MLELKNIKKSYDGVEVLKNINLSISDGEIISILGPSGCGKTTLLNILSTIDKPTQGMVLLDGKDITKMKNKELSKLRRDKIGFIFQDYNLLDTMTLQDNIALPLSLNGVSSQVCIAKSENLASIFGLKEHLKNILINCQVDKNQRGATCRALISEPEILFADEPTGALDSRSSRDLLERLKMI